MLFIVALLLKFIIQLQFPRNVSSSRSFLIWGFTSKGEWGKLNLVIYSDAGTIIEQEGQKFGKGHSH